MAMVPAHFSGYLGRKCSVGSSSSPEMGLFGPEVVDGRWFRPVSVGIWAGSVRWEAAQAWKWAFSGRKWLMGGGSGPFQAVFGPEVIGGRDSGEWKRC